MSAISSITAPTLRPAPAGASWGRVGNMSWARGVALVAVLLSSLLVAGSSAGAGSRTCFGRTATIRGTSGNDVIYGTNGSDVIVGGKGTDQIHGLGGDDFICGEG